MKALAVIFFTLLAVAFGVSQTRRSKPNSAPKAATSIQTATTKDGRTVLLKSDGTWEYTNDPVIPPPSVDKMDHAVMAIKALRVMAGATDVGINFEEYGRRLIDLKAAVESVVGDIPDGELKTEITSSLEAYVDVGEIWNELNQQLSRSRSRVSREPTMFPDIDPVAGKHQKKYAIPTESFTTSGGQAHRIMYRKNIFNTMWAAGRKHLEKAESLAK